MACISCHIASKFLSKNGFQSMLEGVMGDVETLRWGWQVRWQKVAFGVWLRCGPADIRFSRLVARADSMQERVHLPLDRRSVYFVGTSSRI